MVMVIMSNYIYPTSFPRPQSPDSLSRSPPSPNDRLHSRARTTFRFSNSEFTAPLSLHLNLNPATLFIYRGQWSANYPPSNPPP